MNDLANLVKQFVEHKQINFNEFVTLVLLSPEWRESTELDKRDLVTSLETFYCSKFTITSKMACYRNETPEFHEAKEHQRVFT